jgi:L-serine dehydratase
MAISVFDMFKIGIGPSSSHTMGPMRAAGRFLARLGHERLLDATAAVFVDLYGSLALTGRGHGTDKAVMLGLEGEAPDAIDPDVIDGRLGLIRNDRQLRLAGDRPIGFDPDVHLRFHRKTFLPHHPNGLRFTATDAAERVLCERTYYSIGGGFVVDEERAEQDRLERDESVLPFAFRSGKELLALCASHGKSIAELAHANEQVWRPAAAIDERLDAIWTAMDACIERGCRQDGVLPGGLKLQRRARRFYEDLTRRPEHTLRDPLSILDWVNLYAMAVNEENASGGRVVTAPTNGAAGVIPAVIRYYERFCAGTRQGIREFLLTAGSIGILYAQNASISGAEVGCQGEVGVACSMAAAGLAAALGGSPRQVEQAAEIGMEHNLGLTCDPVGGLVQVPCIERNAMGAVKAINAARLALRGDGHHFVSLDSVMRTMRQTGADMKTKYKETSRGGLAVNVSEC